MNELVTCRTVSVALMLAVLCSLVWPLSGHAQGDLSRAVPAPGKALVFVFRVDREPSAAQVPVTVNKELVGELANGTFVAATVGPGPTQLRIGQRLVTTLSFVAAANESYFVRVEAIAGQTLVRTVASPVSEPEGRRALAQSRFVGVAPALVIPPIVTAPAVVAPVAAPPVVPPPVAAPAVVAPVVVTPPVAAPAPPAEPAVAQPAAAPEPLAPAEPGRNWEFALIAKAGTFKMADGDQVINTSQGALQGTYDTTSSSVYGLEAEWRHKSGFALGGEVFSYTNDLVTTGAIPNAQQDVLAFMVNGKYYFRTASWFYPFVGAGIGAARATYSGGLTGDSTAVAYQGMAGMEFRFKPVGLYLQYKYLSSKPGEAGKEINVGGSGAFAGVSVIF